MYGGKKAPTTKKAPLRSKTTSRATVPPTRSIDNRSRDVTAATGGAKAPSKPPAKKAGVSPSTTTTARQANGKPPVTPVARPKTKSAQISKSAKTPQAGSNRPPAKLKSSNSGLQSLSVALERCDCGAADAIRDIERLYHQIKIGGDAALNLAKTEEKRLEDEVRDLEEVKLPNLELEDIPLAQRLDAVSSYKKDLDKRDTNAQNTLRELKTRRKAIEDEIDQLDKRELELLRLQDDIQSELSKVDLKEAPLIAELRQRQNKLRVLEAKFSERQAEAVAIRLKLTGEEKRLEDLEAQRKKYINEKDALILKSRILEKEAEELEIEEKKAKAFFDNKLSEYREYELLDSQLKARERDLNSRLEQLAEAEQRHQDDSLTYERRCNALNLSEKRRHELQDGEGNDDYLTTKRKDVQSKLQALQAKHDLWEQTYDIHERSLQQLQATTKKQDDHLRLLRRQYAYLLESRGLTESQFLDMFLKRSPTVNRSGQV